MNLLSNAIKHQVVHNTVFQIILNFKSNVFHTRRAFNYLYLIIIFLCEIFQNPVVSYLRSNLEYLRGNYQKAINILNTSAQSAEASNSHDAALPVMLYNNIAVCFYGMHKPNIATSYMNKAVLKNNALYKDLVNRNEKG